MYSAESIEKEKHTPFYHKYCQEIPSKTEKAILWHSEVTGVVSYSHKIMLNWFYRFKLMYVILYIIKTKLLTVFALANIDDRKWRIR